MRGVNLLKQVSKFALNLVNMPQNQLYQLQLIEVSCRT